VGRQFDDSAISILRILLKFSVARDEARLCPVERQETPAAKSND